MNDLKNYDEISRESWQDLYRGKIPPLTEEELYNIKSLNDQINMQDVIDVYLPLIYFLRIYMKNREDMVFSKGLFLQKMSIKNPTLIIGISGSVAVGKSTTARLLQTLLSRVFKKTSVNLITTDGFLYPNKILKEKNIMDRKGFPESYDMENLIDSLFKVKCGIEVDIPVYSHEIYDIVPNLSQTISNPDILIVEGINVFQNPHNEQLYIGDLFDFSIYVDADEKNIEKWYLERFESLMKLAQVDPANYYHQFTKWSKDEQTKLARDTWKNVNLLNLEEYIKPTRNKADVILHKGDNHFIDKIYLKKF